MPNDYRPTPPERINVIHFGGTYHIVENQPPEGHPVPAYTYRLSDPADPLVRLSDVERAVQTSLGYGENYKAAVNNIIADLRHLTAEQGEGGEGEGK